jgi:hypothetical protein
MKPNIMVFGPSGTGKSTSLRNLNPETTAVINTEQKALPFRGANKFKMNVPVKDLDTFEKALAKAMQSEKVKVIVIESFTSLFEMIHAKAKIMYSGFDVWDYVKNKVGEYLRDSKNTDKYIIFLGIDMVIDGPNGVEERCVAVDGSWKKKVEKEFVICLYTRTYEEAGETKYGFVTNRTEGFNNISAKSPMDMLPKFMDNDLNTVIQKIEEFYNGEETELKKEEQQVNN